LFTNYKLCCPISYVDFDGLICSCYNSIVADISLLYAAILGQQGFLLISLLSWGLFHHILSWFGLSNICFAGTINWKLFLDLYSSSIKPQDPLIMTYRGGSFSSWPLPCNPPRVTREASLVLDLSITKMRGISIEVTVIGVPSCVTHLLFGLGFSQTTNCAITFLAPLSGRILNPFRSHNDTWQSPMAHPWARNLYKPLNMATIPGYPNNMPKESHKWLPKFTGNNVITPEEHLDAIGVAMEDNSIEHEDVAMKLLATSLDEDAKKWFKGFPDNHLQSYEAFTKLFKNRWTTKKDKWNVIDAIQPNKKERE
jgi:hypothetical protein